MQSLIAFWGNSLPLQGLSGASAKLTGLARGAAYLLLSQINGGQFIGCDIAQFVQLARPVGGKEARRQGRRRWMGALAGHQMSASK